MKPNSQKSKLQNLIFNSGNQPNEPEPSASEDKVSVPFDDGRGRKSSRADNKAVCLRISEQLYLKLQALARLNNTSISAIANAAFEKVVNDYEAEHEEIQIPKRGSNEPFSF